MDPTRTGPIALAETRLRWLDARQRVLAQNVANADTPGYRPSDMRPFAQALAGAQGVMAQTDPRHLAPTRDARTQRERRVERRSRARRQVAVEPLQALAHPRTSPARPR